MTMRDAIRRAVETENPRMLRAVADMMRCRYGLNYFQSLEAVRCVIPTMEAGRWDELMMLADESTAAEWN